MAPILEFLSGADIALASPTGRPAQPPAQSGIDYTYDPNGNLLSDGVNTYEYDTANRLVSVTTYACITLWPGKSTRDRARQCQPSRLLAALKKLFAATKKFRYSPCFDYSLWIF